MYVDILIYDKDGHRLVVPNVMIKPLYEQNILHLMMVQLPTIRSVCSLCSSQ